MAKLTDSLAAALAGCVIENFADIFILDRALEQIAKKHSLDDPEVIAAIATVADVGAAQQRLNAQPAKALVKGLQAALEKPLRPTAKLLVEALLDGAKRAAALPPAPARKTKIPAFARALPPLLDAKGKPASEAETELLLTELMTAKAAPAAPFTAESLARFARALAFGWLSHGAEPKHAWAARAAGFFPDDETARDLGLMARELGPRVGQFSKAQILVDVLAMMNTRVALEMLQELSTKVKTKSVKDRAKAAFEAAAKRAGVSQHDLADKLISDDALAGKGAKDFARRLEQRMVTGSKMPAVELVENILQREAARARARGIVFGAEVKKKLVTFTIGDDALVDIDGKPFVLPSGASVVVVHPLDLAAAQLKKWRARAGQQPFAQLDRPVKPMTARTLAHLAKKLGVVRQGAIYGLESLGWQRRILGGRIVGMTRELDGVAAAIDLAPGIYLGRGLGAVDQSVTKLTLKGKGTPRALAEIGRELATLGAHGRTAASRGRRE